MGGAIHEAGRHMFALANRRCICLIHAHSRRCDCTIGARTRPQASGGRSEACASLRAGRRVTGGARRKRRQSFSDGVLVSRGEDDGQIILRCRYWLASALRFPVATTESVPPKDGW
jgi:hypothetical protein